MGSSRGGDLEVGQMVPMDLGSDSGIGSPMDINAYGQAPAPPAAQQPGVSAYSYNLAGADVDDDIFGAEESSRDGYTPFNQGEPSRRSASRDNRGPDRSR